MKSAFIDICRDIALRFFGRINKKMAGSEREEHKCGKKDGGKTFHCFSPLIFWGLNILLIKNEKVTQFLKKGKN